MNLSPSRRPLVDLLRGSALVSMIGYHALWDLVFLAGVSVPWYNGLPGFLWQQSICWCFILLAGYCQELGSRQLLRGCRLLCCGALIRAVTSAAIPQAPVRFGVLTLIGACTLLFFALGPLTEKIPPAPGLLGSFLLFLLSYSVPQGLFAGLALPRALYRGQLTAFLGFPPAGFISSDYFSLLPWAFLFATGLFFSRLTKDRPPVPAPRVPLLSFLGRRSLAVYLLHQPVLYGLGLAAGLWR